jgi:hypothetical protein
VHDTASYPQITFHLLPPAGFQVPYRITIQDFPAIPAAFDIPTTAWEFAAEPLVPAENYPPDTDNSLHVLKINPHHLVTLYYFRFFIELLALLNS